MVWCRGRSFVEEDPGIGLRWRLVRDAVGKKIPRAEFIETRKPCVNIDRLLFQRLQDYLVADLLIRTSVPSKRNSLGRRTAWLRPLQNSLASVGF